MRHNYMLFNSFCLTIGLILATCIGALAQNLGVDVPTPQEKLDVNGAIRIGNTTNSNAGTIGYSSVSQKFQVNINGTWYDMATTNSSQITNVTYNATTNIITITENGTNWTVNLTDLQDNTDDQAISYNATTNVITLEDGGTINLSDLQDNTDNQTLANVYGQNGNAVTMDATAGDVRFFKVGNEIFMLKESTGYVGIGTTNPTAKLQVVEASTGNALQITESSDGNGLNIAESGNGDALTVTQGGAGNAATFNGGNVGIGTTNALQTLDVRGGARVSTLVSGPNGGVVKTDANGELSFSNFPNDNDQILDGTGNWVDINTMVSGDYIENQTSANQAAGFRITGPGIVNGGNIGIGTTAPAAALNVVDPDESITQTAFTQSLNNSGILVTTDYLNGAYTPGIFWSTTNENPTKPKAGIYLQTNTAGSKMILATSTDYLTGITNSAMVIDQDANVGIGTSSPQYLLDVAGDVNVASGSGFRINGGATAGQYLRGNGTRFVSATIPYTDITGTPTSLPPSGAASGDLSGTYPGPTVARINGSTLGSTTPTSGNVLVANGTQWTSHPMSGDATISGTGVVSLTGSSGTYIKNQSTSAQGGTFWINGVGRVGDGSAATPSLSFNSSGTTGLYRAGADIIGFSTAGAERARINASGQMGIGSTNPNDALDVTGSIDASTSYKYQGTTAIFGSGSDIYANIRVIQNNSGSLTDGMYINYNSTGGTNADLRLFANGTTERMRIRANSGFVGIGTSGPAQMLEIYRDDADVAIGFHDPGDVHYAVGTDRSDGGKFKINYGSGIGDASHFTMTTGGSVGIFSNSPVQALDVAGDINSSNGYRIGNGATTGQYLRGNGTRFVSSAIQAGDIPSGSGNYIQNQWGGNQSANFDVGAGQVGRLEFSGVSGNSGEGNHSYAIFQEAGAWSHPYPDLRIAYHTGIKLGAYYGYNGTRFYNNSDMATEIFSVGNGDNLVRSLYGMYSPILYDYNNSGYYLDPNSSSRLSVIHTDESYTYGWHRNHYSGYGLYNQATGNHLYAEGNYWNMAKSSGNNGLLFRDGYAGSTLGYIYYSGGSFGVLSPNGNWRFRGDNTNSEAYGSGFYAPTSYIGFIYDRDDTGYYTDPNSTTRHYHNRNNYITTGEWGNYNQFHSWTHFPNYSGIYSGNNGAHFYPNNASYGAWRIAGNRNGWYGLEFDVAAGNTTLMMGTTGQGVGAQQIGAHNNSWGWLWYFYHRGLYAGIFYDIDNSGYYVDPASTTQLHYTLANNWFRPQNSTGVYWESYGGGWYMQDGSWVRVYNNRSMLSQINSGNPAIRGDQAYSGWYAGEFNSYDNAYGPAVYARGYMYAYTYYGYSTKSMKHDIEKFSDDDYESALAFMDDLDLNYYKMNGEYENYPKVHVGLIAEETPTTLTAPGKQGVSYGELAVFNTGAIKAMKKEMAEIKSQLKNVSDFGAENITTGSMYVSFSPEFVHQLNGADPIVVLTPSQTGTVLNLTNITKTGFEVENPNGKGVTFSWIAMAKVENADDEPKMTEKFDNMVKSAENDTRPVPVKTYEEPAPGIIDPRACDTSPKITEITPSKDNIQYPPLQTSPPPQPDTQNGGAQPIKTALPQISPNLNVPEKAVQSPPASSGKSGATSTIRQ